MDNNEYISKQKVEKWTTKEKFNALGDLRDIEPGTEYNITGAIEEGELDAALQAKINRKLYMHNLSITPSQLSGGSLYIKLYSMKSDAITSLENGNYVAYLSAPQGIGICNLKVSSSGSTIDGVVINGSNTTETKVIYNFSITITSINDTYIEV